MNAVEDLIKRRTDGASAFSTRTTQDHHNTLANYPNAFVILILGLQPCHIFFHHIPELHQKSEHFWTFPTLTSYSNHLNSNQTRLNLNLLIMDFSIFSEQDIFVCPGKVTACPN